MGRSRVPYLDSTASPEQICECDTGLPPLNPEETAIGFREAQTFCQDNGVPAAAAGTVEDGGEDLDIEGLLTKKGEGKHNPSGGATALQHYQPRGPDFFERGRIFSRPMPREPAVVDKMGNRGIPLCDWMQVERFVVVNRDARSGVVFCYPITTYGGKGWNKEGINPDEHAALYSGTFRGGQGPNRHRRLWARVYNKASLGDNSLVVLSSLRRISPSSRIRDVGTLSPDSTKTLVWLTKWMWERLGTQMEGPLELEPEVEVICDVTQSEGSLVAEFVLVALGAVGVGMVLGNQTFDHERRF
jgi:hypothetical protein